MNEQARREFNMAVIGRHLADEERRIESGTGHECPSCHERGSMNRDELCSSCTAAALARYGWL